DGIRVRNVTGVQTCALPILPVLLPLICGALLMTSSRSPQGLVRSISAVSVVLLLLCAVYLLMTASNGQIQVYALGNWSAPFGIEIGRAAGRERVSVDAA